MSKDYPTELHGGYDSSMDFTIVVGEATDRIRQGMDFLPRHRKADSIVGGAIHALRKLCEGEKLGHLLDCRLYKSEVEAWRREFFAWFNRVKGRYSPESRAQFQANAEDDFRVLLEVAQEDGRSPFTPPTERYLRVTFKSQEAKDAACAAADEKHPVQLGHALSKYLDRCIRELVDEPLEDTIELRLNSPQALTTARKAARDVHPTDYGDPLHEYLQQCVRTMVRDWEASNPVGQQRDPAPAAVSPCFLRLDDGRFSLTLNDFSALDDDKDADWELTAYDVESGVKAYLSEHRPSCVKHLRFDSESSMFCVVSSRISALSHAAEVIFRFLGDEKLRRKYIRRATDQ